LIILIILGEEYKSRSSSLCNFLHPPVISSFFYPNILLSTLFSNTLSLCSSLSVTEGSQIRDIYEYINYLTEGDMERTNDKWGITPSVKC
jgi:hypothetical protein